MFNLFGKSRKSVSESVVFDQERVTRTMANGKVETINWTELCEIESITTNKGPFVDDVFWLLVSKEGGVAIPSETAGLDQLLLRLQELPGFDNAQVILAMGCTDNASFIVWKDKKNTAKNCA